MSSISICFHGLCTHSMPTCDCTRLNVARLIHSDAPHAPDVDVLANTRRAGDIAWAAQRAPNKTIVPGLPIARRLEYGVTLRGAISKFLTRDEQHAIFCCKLTHVTGISSTVHLQDRFLLLRVPNSARGPSQACRGQKDDAYEARNGSLSEEVLRATRVVLSSTRDMLFDDRYRVTPIAHELLWPIWEFLQTCDPPAEYVNTFAELSEAEIIFGDEDPAARPVLPFYVPLPRPQCELPAGQLVCCCGRPTLGDAQVLGSDVGRLEILEDGE
ncbi:hypothetical protein PENSPDRAFT_693418 [Peniophora sp. CONT]|nr:hypothetical protein PENSPDRAFT_693418 [Peniophora sp. CONT]